MLISVIVMINIMSGYGMNIIVIIIIIFSVILIVWSVFGYIWMYCL